MFLEDRHQKRRKTRSPSPNGMDPPSNKKAKRGLAGFSIDDILSHKTAAVMKEHEQMMKIQQVCKRSFLKMVSGFFCSPIIDLLSIVILTHLLLYYRLAIGRK